MAERIHVPARFLTIPYNGAIHPGVDHPTDLSTGANCQVFAYAVLKHFGLDLPPLRSSDLWDDTIHTRMVAELEPLDLLLFGPTADAYGAHVALYLGKGEAIHLSKAVGTPAIWPIERFVTTERYRVFIGAKRVLASVDQTPPLAL
ncbi:NlpC/P60 family protein [Devosia sp. Leaf64]|uniref:NlpC/P60 family protein n=1 Tax=Devosia sp. Leaf64 TaxID=1736229 RepID=UPI000712E565|nr:NlpC/P60 family protein [Devosia sp. Leaf64]KQN70091.1 hypothetical protein ASE94_13545 [Devosia sp. Leaf64]